MAKIHSAPGIGARIQAARKAKGLSSHEVAELVGVHFTTVHAWERGANPHNQRNKTGEHARKAYEQMMELLEIDTTPREEPRETAAPVSVTKQLRVALSTPDDEFRFSKTKILHSIQYLAENIPVLLDRLERTDREIHRLEQSQGITQEQLAILRDKARRYDQMQELLERKAL